MDGTSHLSVGTLDNDTNGSQPGVDRIDLASNVSMDENNPGRGPAIDNVDHNDEVVILIVGNAAEDKTGVVESLTTGEWTDDTTCGFRVRTCKSPARVIVDTTPLRNVRGMSPTAIARRWISRNTLRRIVLGKDVVVVCVLTGRVQNTCQSDMFSSANCWVDVLGLIFKRHRGAIMILVNTQGVQEFSDNITLAVERFVLAHGFSTKNITYSQLNGDESVKGVIESSICRRVHGSQIWTYSFESFTPPRKSRARNRPAKHPPHSTVRSFQIGDALLDKENYGPWGPERVILFGRTGNGKSTLAQMLTLGKIDRKNTTFVPSDGIRGGTREMQPGIGRGWYVLDTPGFGEPKGKLSTISTQDAQTMVTKYVKNVDGTFSHYLYVARKERLDVFEERLWKFFMLLFGEEIHQQFTVVVAGADEDWVQENLVDLKNTFKGCDSFVSADFPAINERDEVLESEYQEVRTESLSALEQQLAKANRADMECRYGKRSSTQLRMEVVRANGDIGIERNERIQFFIRGAFMIFACCNISHRPFVELTNLLKVDDKIALIPI